MNRRAFLKWLGIGVPAVAVAAVIAPKLMESKVVEARLGEWNNYYSEGDAELMKSIENWKSYPVHHTTTTLPVSKEWESGIYYDKEFMKTLKEDNPRLFLSLASRNKIQVSAPVKREFFQYNVKS